MTTQHFGHDKHPYSIEYIPVGELTTPVDSGQVPYQRDQGDDGNPPAQMAARTAKYGEYDHRILRYREVNRRRDGVLAAMDGNGSNHWLEDMFGYGYLVPCKVYNNLPIEEEAKMFELFQHIKQVSLSDRYNADVIAGESTALAIQKVFEEEDFSIGSRAPDKVSYSAAKYAIMLGEADLLRRTIKMVKVFPQTSRRRTNSELFKAIADALANSNVTDAGVRDVLAHSEPDDLLEQRNGYAAHSKALENIMRRARRYDNS